ncbi:MAG: RNA recognition motif domain-containing protein [Acidobacteriota bacterium]|jgi:RNA recognition motif-containing protein
MKKLFVGNISFQSSEADLQNWFTEQGLVPVALAIVRHRLTGDSRGFGFAEFATETAARQALQALDGAEYQGRRLMISAARSDAPTVQDKSASPQPE